MLSTEKLLAADRVEQLFLWKLSEELKLNPKQEKELTAFIQDLNHKKIQLNKQIDLLVRDFKEPQSPTKQLKEYRQLMSNYNQISLSEIDGVQKILGTKDALKYLFLKNELSLKIKSILSSQDKEKKALPDPKVIEE